MQNSSFFFWNVNSKFELNTPLILVFETLLEMIIKGIRVRYAELITLLSIFKGTGDMNESSSHKS